MTNKKVDKNGLDTPVLSEYIASEVVLFGTAKRDVVDRVSSLERTLKVALEETARAQARAKRCTADTLNFFEQRSYLLRVIEENGLGEQLNGHPELARAHQNLVERVKKARLAEVEKAKKAQKKPVAKKAPAKKVSK